MTEPADEGFAELALFLGGVAAGACSEGAAQHQERSPHPRVLRAPMPSAERFDDALRARAPCVLEAAVSRWAACREWGAGGLLARARECSSTASLLRSVDNRSFLRNVRSIILAQFLLNYVNLM